MGTFFALLLTLAATAAPPTAGPTVTVPATDRTPALPAYIARPSAAKAPGVVILHGCGGYGPRYAAIADWLAASGYVAVAIDSLKPRGQTSACDDTNGSRNEAEDARATLRWMRTLPYVEPTRLALLGYSMGAIAALDLVVPREGESAPPGLRGAVAYYPSCRNRDARDVLTPLRILDGSADDWTPPEPCQAFADMARKLGKPVSITTYPGATHAFDIDLPARSDYGHTVRYDPVAAQDARAQTLTFLRTAVFGASLAP